ncbi:restriction endonuclease subunit S [Paenibacillus chibensis]|uniref:restriction endonuclease subunit S n=1 Tax=Paenibacillus chibensis TaxID=59846 RepID=UPI001C3FF4BC|nr:restriction endonuclease subunit S [Paenibacillus chibensis]MEC0373569.1 restriction endonuclease subunit S [Paenibacillus chibensis]
MVNTWSIVKLGDLLEFKNGLNKGKSFFGYGIPIINYMDVYRGNGIYKKQLKGKVHLTKEEIKRFDVKKGDVFFTRTSETPEEVGYSNVMIDDIEECVFSGFVLRARPKNDWLDINYCKYCFSTPEVRNAIMSGCTYTTRALTNGRQLSSIEIPLPEKAEQIAIAEALSDADSLIASLDKLIAKKKAIKQGAMHELFTGKRRLPGFSGEWIESPFKTICEFINGRAFSQDELLRRGKYRVLRLGNLFTSDSWYYSDLELPESQYCDKNDLIYAWSASFGPALWKEEKVIFHYHIWKVICSNKIDKHYLYYYFMFDVQKILHELQGGTMFHLTKETIEKRKCFYPSVEEQIAIATLLSDMDVEIEHLEKQLEKYRLIKQGIMQELLTGRIRLVNNGVDQNCSHD